MKDDNIIWKIEESLWLKGIELFEKYLADECLMAFTKPTGILLKTEVLTKLKAAPRWDSVEIINPKSIHRGAYIITIGYEAHAMRAEEKYRAICSSSYTYVDQEWSLFQHHQTPLL